MNKDILIKNLNILIAKTGLEDQAIAEKINYSKEHFSSIKNGKHMPMPRFLKSISNIFREYISELSSYDFRNGQALFTENFDEILQKNSLTNSQNNSKFLKSELEEWEEDYIFKLRHIINKSDVISLDPHYLALSLKCHAVMGRDERLMQSFIDVIEALSKL